MSDSVNILIADDDMEDRMILQESFDVACPGTRISFVEDGIEVIDYLKNDMPTIIVLDLNMPRMNGVETLRSVKELPGCNSIPVIILSTSINELQKKECFALGASHYLTKPTAYKESLRIAEFIREFAVKCT